MTTDVLHHPVGVAGLALVLGVAAIAGRWMLGRVLTLRAAAWTPIASRWLSRWVTSHGYGPDEFFLADGATHAVAAVRRAGIERLAADLKKRCAGSAAWARTLRDGFSDIRFADANRVPFPFAPLMRQWFDLTTVVTASDGPRLRDLDGRWSLDVSGSYGVNVAGFDRYKVWIEQGWQRVVSLGPVLGPVHPLVADNVALLRAVSGLDEVSFHMSGTEAVMAAVRLARFNTGRRLIVTFSGAYHGWWDGVVPGLGSDRPLDDCLTLTDMSGAALSAIRHRADEIAAVLVNPVQSFHPNAPPPSDAVLVSSGVRRVRAADREYAQWLADLRSVCTAAGVPLILDEVYTGFRLAPRGAQDYFGVQADIVVYGKTVAGGLPIGVVCGRRELMRRFDPDHPMRLAYVVGTFSAHPLVMGAMYEFLSWATSPAAEASYDALNDRVGEWVESTNRRLQELTLPVRVANLGSIWTVLFTAPGRFNWLLQYYLRARGVMLSWVGTGRCLCSMDFRDEHFAGLREALVGAAQQMQDDAWWLDPATHAMGVRRMQRHLITDALKSLVPMPVRRFHSEVMLRKDEDHHASHNDLGNQMLHLVSSSVFLYCYAILFVDLTQAMCFGLAALFLRQFGHAVLEPDSHERELTLLGYTTRNKTAIVGGYALIPLWHVLPDPHWALFLERLPDIARHWWLWTQFVIALRVAWLIWKFDVRTSLVWYVKLVTDPLTDVIAYFPRRHRAYGAQDA